jgi:hypothetical protein
MKESTVVSEGRFTAAPEAGLSIGFPVVED